MTTPETHEINALAVRDPRVASAIAREAMQMRVLCERAQTLDRQHGRVERELTETLNSFVLADRATWRLRYGGSEKSGPSVWLARELARMYGAMRWGLRVIETTEERAHVQGYAMDLASCLQVEQDAQFSLRVPRKDPRDKKRTLWVIPEDEATLQGVILARGARAVRGALLQLLPARLIEHAVAVSEATIARHMAQPESKRQMLVDFGRLGVSQAMIEKRLGCTVQEAAPQQLAMLRGVYNSLVDGHTSARDAFSDEEDDAGMVIVVPPAKGTPSGRLEAEEVEDAKTEAPEANAPEAQAQEPEQEPASDAPSEDVEELIDRLGDAMAKHRIAPAQVAAAVRRLGVPTGKARELKPSILARLVAQVAAGSLEA